MPVLTRPNTRPALTPPWPLEILESPPTATTDVTVASPASNPPTPPEELEPPQPPKTDVPVESEVTAPVSTSDELSVAKGPAPAKRRNVAKVLVAILLLLAVIAGATGYYIARQSPIIYQSSLKGSVDNWENDAACAPKAGGYYITRGSICYAPIGNQANADIKVTVVQQSGPSDLFYGIALRSMPGEHYYLFAIDGDGKWLFVNVPGMSRPLVDLIDPTLDNAVRAGLDQANTLEVKMKGTHFQFSINGIKVGEIDDSHYAAGQIGLSGEDGVAVVYTDLSIVKIN
ncbi:MAG: hypothetical protein ACLQUY_00880 [Ktedonobacterales bacterium]